MPTLLSPSSLYQSLNLADLTDPSRGFHAMQQLITHIHNALTQHWQCCLHISRNSPVVSLENNYDRLGYPSDGAARDERYTRYVTDKMILRTQTSSAIPDLLLNLCADPPQDLLLVLPGMVFRRDSIDRLHCAQPHQLDLWRIVDSRSNKQMSFDDLQQMIAIVMQTALPNMSWRIVHSAHPYTEQGVQIDVYWDQQWVEVGECGITSREILDNGRLPTHTGLAMGLGLDRLLMLRKNIPDIRLLRNNDPRIRRQMNDLLPYQAVSVMPAIERDLSICVEQTYDEELIGDKLRSQLPEAHCIESLQIKSTTLFADLPSTAHARMGMHSGQKNLLLQLTIRHLQKTLTDQEANHIRNKVYLLLHQGAVQELAASAQ